MNKPIKVCLSSLFFPPDFSGAGLRFQRYMPGLAERGIHFTVFAGEFGEQPPTSTPLSTSEYLSIQRVPMSKALDKHSLRQYLKAIIDYCSHPDTRPDILHFLSTKSAWFALYPALYRLKIPIIYSHTLINNRPKSGIQRFTYPFIQRFAVSPAHQIIVNSQRAKQQYKDLGITKKIVYIPNGVDLKRFHPILSSNDKQKLRAKLNLPAEIPIVIFVGSIIARKGVDTLLKSWRIVSEQNPNTLLLLVGPTAREYSQYSLTYHTYVEKLLTKMSAPNKIIMTGQVSNVVDYLKSSDIFVFTSLNEGMPNAVLEAYSCGLPCVLTMFDGLEESLGKPNSHYILAERNPLKIANAILDLLSHPEKASRLGREARLLVEQTLNIETTLDLYAQAYFDILNSVHSDR
jgi:glycosyltransferase involved in cell wall biosynthesis